MINAQKMKNRDIGLKIASIGVAVLIWVLVANINDPIITKRFSDIKVTVKNENALTDNGYAYEITEGDAVSFTIKGKKSIVSNMTDTDFDVVADFSKLSVTDAVPIDVFPKKNDGLMEITLGNVNTMKIKTDEIVRINLPVNVYYSDGSVADGYAIGKTTATPNLIEVSGPKKLLSEAKEIRAEIDPNGINKNVTTTVKPKLYNNDGELIESSQIDLGQTYITVSIELWKTKKVKVNIVFEGEPEEGYALSSSDYEPKQVLVAASDDIYSELHDIDLATVSLDGLNKTYEEDISVSSDSFPSGVILAENLNSIKVNAKIEKIKTRKLKFSKSDIKVKNNPEGYKVEYDSGNSYYAELEGASSKVDAVKVEDLAPWIDLSDLEEGDHEITIHVKDKDSITVEDISRINITLTK